MIALCPDHSHSPVFYNFQCAELEGSCHIQGHWVASHRQKVDTSTKDLKPLSCMSKSRRHSYNINRVLGHYYCGWPPVCLFSVYMTLPDVITHNEIPADLPPSFLHTVSDEKNLMMDWPNNKAKTWFSSQSPSTA